MAERRILVVDDAGLVRLYYREALRSAGYRVAEALNGLEAMEKVLDGGFDLLIVDVNMPKMDGLTFLRGLRRHEGTLANVPALITSTESGPQDRQAAREAGANFYLVKPITREDLLHHVALLTGSAP